MLRLRAVDILLLCSSVALCVLAGPPPAVAPQESGTRALTIEDYYRIQDVGGPAISPNGKWVVYTVRTPIEEDNSSRSEVYLVAADGSKTPRRIVHYGRDVGDPRFSDDGALEYTADGEWKIDPEKPDGIPTRVRRRPGRMVISPDGKWLASVDEVRSERSQTVYSSEFEERHEKRFKGVVFDWKDFQRDGQPFPAPDPTRRPALRIVLTSVSGGEPRTLVDKDLRPDNVVWHPKGDLLLFIADSQWRDELTYGRSDLWTVDLNAQVTRMTDDPYSYSDADFSPDGKYLSYIRTFGTDMVIAQKLNHGGPRDLFIRPVAGGDAVNLTADWDHEPRSPQWAPDGGHIYFTAGIGGEAHLFKVSVPHGEVVQVTRGERRLNGLVIDKDFTTIAYTVGLHETPEDVYAADIDGSNERRLTDVHRNILSEVAFSRTQRLGWSSYDGTSIEGWLTFPYDYDSSRGPYPLIVFSHGGPHSATGYGFNFKKQYFAAHGYFVLDTNFRSSTGYGEAFKWATWGEWGNKDGQDVVSGIDYVLQRYPIDSRRVGHTGHSYGGFMTNWLITQYPDRFAAAITGAGISNWISDYGTADIYRTKETEFYGPPWDAAARERLIKQSPLTYADRVRTPTLFVHGEVDQRVPYEEAEQMYFALKRRGIPAKMIQYAGQAHGIRGHWNAVHRMINELKWWNLYLKGVSKTSY